MNRSGIGTVGIFSLLALVFPFTLFAEVRTLQEFDTVGRTWSETVENTAEPDGGRSLKIQDPTETRVARYDVAGKLRSLAISVGRETFQAAKAVWLGPDGRLVAQKVLPPPKDGLKTVLQEVIGSQS